MILHDHIGQILAMSKIKLGSLLESPPSWVDAGGIREIREYVDQAINYTRSLTLELSPPILYALGLEAALEWLSEQIMEDCGINCEFENDSEPKPVSEEIRVFTFTAVRELLANVVKHAHASRAKVTVRRINRSIVIHVADDGVGFNPSKFKTQPYDNKGFGLFSIRERLRHLGGQMEVKSAKGRGARVILEGPLNTEYAPAARSRAEGGFIGTHSRRWSGSCSSARRSGPNAFTTPCARGDGNERRQSRRFWFGVPPSGGSGCGSPFAA